MFEPGVAGVPSLVVPRKWTGKEGVEVENPRVGKWVWKSSEKSG